MKMSIPRILGLGGVLAATACASTPSPTAKAAAVERTQCDASTSSDQSLTVVRTATVLHFEPLYSHVVSAKSDGEERINGAKLIVRQPAGVSADQLTRILQCHSARLLLGKASGNIQNDPYWLPDSWVNIDVRPDNGNYVVTLSADTIDADRQVFDRANRYADDHMLATDPGLP